MQKAAEMSTFQEGERGRMVWRLTGAGDDLHVAPCVACGLAADGAEEISRHRA